MKHKECVRTKYNIIAAKFHAKYGFTPDSPLVRNSWVFFKVVRGAYALLQSGKLAYDLLRKRLNADGYHKTLTTPNL